LQNGKFLLTSEVQEEAKKQSDRYVARVAERERGEFVPTGKSPKDRENASKKPAVPPAVTTPVRGTGSPSQTTPATANQVAPTVTPPVQKKDAAGEVKMLPADSVKGTEQKQISPTRNVVVATAAAKGLPAANTPNTSSNEGYTMSNEDLSKKGYTLIGGKGGVKKWRKGDGISSASEKASDQTTKNVVTSPMLRDRPDAPRPFTTKYDMNQGRVVATGGTPDKAFVDYDKAQKNSQAGNATKEERDLVGSYATKDVLGRTQYEIDRVREDEKKGLYQAGRYVGPERNIDRNKKDYEAQQEKARFDAKVAANVAKAQKTGTYKFPTE
jgi:hypothetical protein